MLREPEIQFLEAHNLSEIQFPLNKDTLLSAETLVEDLNVRDKFLIEKILNLPIDRQPEILWQIEHKPGIDIELAVNPKLNDAQFREHLDISHYNYELEYGALKDTGRYPVEKSLIINPDLSANQLYTIRQAYSEKLTPQHLVDNLEEWEKSPNLVEPLNFPSGLIKNSDSVHKIFYEKILQDIDKSDWNQEEKGFLRFKAEELKRPLLSLNLDGNLDDIRSAVFDIDHLVYDYNTSPNTQMQYQDWLQQNKVTQSVIKNPLTTNEAVLAYYEKINPEFVGQVRMDGGLDVPGVGGGQWNIKDEDPEYLAQLFAKATGEVMHKNQEKHPQQNDVETSSERQI